MIVLLAAVVAAISIGIESSKYPSEWDERVLDLVDFVEDARGYSFRHPVHIDFLTPEEYTATVTVADGELTDEELEDLGRLTAAYRAVGMVESAFDPIEAINELSDEGTLAFYNPEEKRIVVRGTELDTDLRVTLVHELTHALQDQHFDFDYLEDVDNTDAAVAFRGLVEGDAMRIEDDYVAQLPEEEQAAYRGVEEDFDVDFEEMFGDVPPVLVVFFAAPYELGGAFVRALERYGGPGAIDDAFDRPPGSGLELMNPWTYLARSAGPTEVTLPEPAEGAQVPDDAEDVFGAIDLYLMLAQRIDPPSALAAVDTWGGGSFRIEEEPHGEELRVCVALGFVGTAEHGPEPLHHVLDVWRDTMPAEAGVTVERVADQINIRSCDPGAAEAESDPARLLTALLVPALRAYFYADLVGLVGDERALCMAMTFSSRLSWDHYLDLDDTFWDRDDINAIGDHAAETCLA